MIVCLQKLVNFRPTDNWDDDQALTEYQSRCLLHANQDVSGVISRVGIDQHSTTDVFSTLDPLFFDFFEIINGYSFMVLSISFMVLSIYGVEHRLISVSSRSL